MQVTTTTCLATAALVLVQKRYKGLSSQSVLLALCFVGSNIVTSEGSVHEEVISVLYIAL